MRSAIFCFAVFSVLASVVGAQTRGPVPGACTGCVLTYSSSPAGPNPISMTVTYGAGSVSGHCQGPAPCEGNPCKVTFFSYTITPSAGTTWTGSVMGGAWINPVFVQTTLTAATTFYVGTNSDPQDDLFCGESSAFASWNEGLVTKQYSVVCSKCPE